MVLKRTIMKLYGVISGSLLQKLNMLLWFMKLDLEKKIIQMKILPRYRLVRFRITIYFVEDFLAKIRAIRYAFLELGVDDGVIVARTDSLGAGLTKQIAVTRVPGDLGDQYNSFLDCEEVDVSDMNNGDVVIKRGDRLLRPKRLPSNRYSPPSSAETHSAPS